jgi:hypothetical protein
VKKMLLKLLILLSIGTLNASLLISPVSIVASSSVVAATTAPNAENKPSGNGFAINLWFLGYWIWNGITTQPGDANFVQGSSGQIIKLTSTYKPKPWIGSNDNDVTGVQTRIYRNGGWSNLNEAKVDISKTTPSANISVDLGTALPSGTYYLQFAVKYSNNTTAYSQMIRVTIVPEPVSATDMDPKPDRPTLFWGESTGIHANLIPGESTANVTWTQPNNQYGSLAVTTGSSTQFLSTQDNNNSIVPLMKNPSGLKVIVPVTATNQDGSQVHKDASVTVGGLLPNEAIRGHSFSYTPESYQGIVFPEGSTQSYQWTVYDANYTKVSSTSGMVLNNKTFSWNSVTQPPVDDHFYLQLDIKVKTSAGDAVWRSNYAPLKVNDPQVRLIAVPNLRFAKFVNGAAVAPTVRDFLQPTGLTLSYFPLAGQTGKNTFDGNNSGFLAVQTQGPKWSLSVSASTFVHETNVALATTPTLTLGLPSSNVSVPANGTPVVLFTNQTGDLMYTFYNNTRLQIPKTGSILAGRYQSQLTWTLTQAP